MVPQDGTGLAECPVDLAEVTITNGEGEESWERYKLSSQTGSEALCQTSEKQTSTAVAMVLAQASGLSPSRFSVICLSCSVVTVGSSGGAEVEGYGYTIMFAIEAAGSPAEPSVQDAVGALSDSEVM